MSIVAWMLHMTFSGGESIPDINVNSLKYCFRRLTKIMSRLVRKIHKQSTCIFKKLLVEDEPGSDQRLNPMQPT